ncbi:MAG: hypothetical protein NZQ09_16995, partial [Chloroflexus sp.]|nr:hypothetical protein [Chloroflexus sp.]
STTSETTAQGGAHGAKGTVKIRLSAPVQARFIRIGMRNTSASYTIREFYPRSVVQADDIAGETLSAISANLGTITAGSISSVSIDAVTITGSTINGGTITGTTINGGTITGTTVQTATSGSRVVLNSSGLFTYNSANQIVAQITTTTNGEILVGSKLRLTPDTITFLQPDTSYTGINVIFPSGNFNLLFENAQFTDTAKLTYQSTNGLSSASIDFIQGKQINTTL